VEHFGVLCEIDPVSASVWFQAESVILKLMESRLDKGHILFTDKISTSVPFAKQLLTKKTHTFVELCDVTASTCLKLS